jgi:hypothetical protein
MKVFDEKSIKVKKEIKSLNPHDEIRVSGLLSNDYLSLKDNKDNLIEMPITAMRILFKIISDLRFSQYQTASKYQVSLFEEEFKSQNNLYASFSFNTVDIIGDTKNKDAVKHGLEFLTEYKKGWYISKNSKGKEVENYGGLITSASTLKGKISFLISGYWLEKIVDATTYNDTLYQMAFKLKNTKHVLFYLWLHRLKNNSTAVNFNTINKNFKLNYKEAKVLAKMFLKPMKTLFDLYGSISFNYSVSGDLINIITYNNLNKENILKEDTFIKVKVKSKALYWRRRHQLLPEQNTNIKNIIEEPTNLEHLEKAYKMFILYCKQMKLNPVDLKGEDFLKEFQKYIDKEFESVLAFDPEKKAPKVY